ncbi:MAG: dipeptide ABC transporter ATP-binding protein [Sciscionella sp.]
MAGAPILHGVSYSIAPGEVLALVGESGSGKTTAGLAALGHFRSGLRQAGGSVTVQAREGDPSDILQLGDREKRALRGSSVSYIPQDPALSLNPGLRIGRQIAEVLRAHGYSGSAERRAQRVREVLGEVGLPEGEDYQRRYPHQLSGGQQQRVGIAMAFACLPSVVVLDEPTTGLDVTTQALILQTIGRLTAEHAVAALYITHDLAVVAAIADRVAVMYQGAIVEAGPARQVLHQPHHAYTRRLMEAVPDIDGVRRLAPEAAATAPAAKSALLAVSDISLSYGDHRVLKGVGITIEAGSSLLLLGESGSGKTTLSRCVCGLVEHYTGSVELAGTGLACSTKDRSAAARRDVQYVFQSPFSSLNPRKTIAQSLEVPLAWLTDLSRAQRRKRVFEVLDQVRFSQSIAHRLPEQLSGGERQRAAIARALVTTPKVLVCDEVTSALDVSVQATIIELLGELRRELGMAMLFVTHNIALARHVADRIAVLRGGEIVESGTVEEVLTVPKNPYTSELLANTPRL